MGTLKGFKTVAFGAILALLAIFSDPDMQAWVAENIPAVGSVISVIIVTLRALTSSSIFKREPDA